MSLSEQKIREELEEEVENDLEKEIKDGIYGLAMKLHKLYMHQRERREGRAMKRSPNIENKQRKTTVSEVNINIKMEGRTKVEIKEIKKEGRSRDPNPKPKFKPKQAHNGRRVKFDWTQSLRSRSDDSGVVSKNEGKNLDKGGNTFMPRKIALLELGWKC